MCTGSGQTGLWLPDTERYSCLVFIISFRGRYYSSSLYFTDKETEVQWTKDSIQGFKQKGGHAVSGRLSKTTLILRTQLKCLQD